MIGKKDTIAIFESYQNYLKEQTTNPVPATGKSTPPVAKTNVQQQNVGDIVKQIRTEVDSTDKSFNLKQLSTVLSVINQSDLIEPQLKKNMQNLLKNQNVIQIFNQIKNMPSKLQGDADLINLQAGSVSEPGSPSATGFKQP